MSNATIQNVMSAPPVYTEGNESSYHQYEQPSSEFNVYGGFGHWLQNPGTYASAIWHEAQRFDVLTNAYTEHGRRESSAAYDQRAAAQWAPVVVAVEQFDQDTQAALVQAELLGATADQRAKLRAMVTARVTAERERDTLRARLTSVQQALDTANEEILDGHDPRTMQLFANTGAVADAQGLCSVYDQIARESLIPTRPELADAGYVGETAEHDYYVTVNVTVYVSTSVRVTARDEDSAAAMVGNMDNRDIWDNLDLGNASYYDISNVETGDVEEAD